MKKFGCILTALLLCLSLIAHAEGLTLYTVSSFAGTDAAADSYVELLKTFEEESGCTIVDNSATSSEEWKASVLNDFAAGNEPDVMFFFAASADSAPLLSRVVSIAGDQRGLSRGASAGIRRADRGGRQGLRHSGAPLRRRFICQHRSRLRGMTFLCPQLGRYWRMRFFASARKGSRPLRSP